MQTVDRASQRYFPAANDDLDDGQRPSKQSGTGALSFGPYPAGSWLTLSVIGANFHVRCGSGAQTATTSDALLPEGVHDFEVHDIADARVGLITSGASITVSAWRSSKA
jgi:hypothetical protein